MSPEPNLFVYVQTLDLLRWNDIFAEDLDTHVSVFAIELAVPLAIYHEIEMPGALAAWHARKGDLDEAPLAPRRDDRWHSPGNVKQLLPVPLRDTQVLAIRTMENGAIRHSVFTDQSSSRVKVRSGDVALFKSSD